MQWACDWQPPSRPPTILLNCIRFSSFADKEPDINLNKDKMTHVIFKNFKCSCLLQDIIEAPGRPDTSLLGLLPHWVRWPGRHASPYTNVLLWFPKTLSFFMCHLISWPVPWECVLHTFHFTRKRTRAREINRLVPVTWKASGRALLQPVEEYFTLLSSLLLPRTGGGGDRWAELCWDTPASQYQCVSFLLLIFTETLRLGKGSRSGWRELR